MNVVVARAAIAAAITFVAVAASTHHHAPTAATPPPTPPPTTAAPTTTVATTTTTNALSLAAAPATTTGDHHPVGSQVRPSTTTAASAPRPRPQAAADHRAVPTATRYACPAAVAAMTAAGAPAATLATWDAVAWRESRCQLSAHRRTASGDDSWCWFQIEYGHGLGAARSRTYGPPALLAASPAACARAALSLWHTTGWGPWAVR